MEKKDKINKIQSKIDKLLAGDVNDQKILDKVDVLERQIKRIDTSVEEDESQEIVVPETPKAPIDHAAVYANLIAIPSARKIYRNPDEYNSAHSSIIHDDGKEKLTYSSLKRKKR